MQENRKVSFNIDVIEEKEELENNEIKELNLLEDLNLDEYLELLNIFQIYYNQKYNNNVKENMFEKIDMSDPTSTNRSLELFYNYIHEYKVNKNVGEEYITVYNLDEFNKVFDAKTEIEKNYDIYILTENNLTLYSMSFLSLILYLQVNLENYYEDNWKIIKLNIEE